MLRCQFSLPAAVLCAAVCASSSAVHADAGTDVCTAINKVNSFDIGGVKFAELPTCSLSGGTNTYYLGSSPVNGTVTDLFTMPNTESIAYFCALAESHGVTSTAVWSPLGQFGVLSSVRITKRDYAGGVIRGERLGTIYLFGVGIPIEKQAFEFKFINENAGQGSSRQGGRYITVKNEGARWDFTPSTITVPVPMPYGTAQLTFDVDLHGRAGFESLNNNLVVGTANPIFDYPSWVTCRQTCPGPNLAPDELCSCGPNRAVPYSKYVTDHGNTSNPLNPFSTTDGRLPWLGAFGGAPSLSPGTLYMEPHRQWFHFGPVGLWTEFSVAAPFIPYHTALNEPLTDLRTTTTSNSLLDKRANLWADIGFTASYTNPTVSVVFSMSTFAAFRDGFAVREHTSGSFELGHENQDEYAAVWTALDAETELRISETLTVDLSLPLYDPPAYTVRLPDMVNRDFEVWSSPGVDITFDYADPSVIGSYWKRSANQSAQPAADPSQAVSQCLNSPPPPAPTGTLGNPGTFLKDVATAAITAVNPCNARYCYFDTTFKSYYTFTCPYDSATKQMKCSFTPGCHTCENRVALCDKNGGELPGTEKIFSFNNPGSMTCLR